MKFKKSIKGVSKEEVRTGTKIEKEHTSDPNVARKIAIDHLAETGPGYYPALKKMEAKLEKDGGIGRVFGRARYRWEQMQKGKKKTTTKSEVESPGELMAFLRSKGHRVSSSRLLESVEKKAGEAFIDEMVKISSAVERSGQWVGRALSSIRKTPGKFVSSVRKGYRGAPSPRASVPSPQRNIYGGDPGLAASVQRAMKSMKEKKKPAFPSKKVKLRSSTMSVAPTRGLIR